MKAYQALISSMWIGGLTPGALLEIPASLSWNGESRRICSIRIAHAFARMASKNPQMYELLRDFALFRFLSMNWKMQPSTIGTPTMVAIQAPKFVIAPLNCTPPAKRYILVWHARERVSIVHGIIANVEASVDNQELWRQRQRFPYLHRSATNHTSLARTNNH